MRKCVGMGRRDEELRNSDVPSLLHVYKLFNLHIQQPGSVPISWSS